LLRHDLAGEADVEPQEVDQLAGRVDLGLVGGFRLTKHGRGAQLLAPGSGQQVGGAQEDSGAFVERRGLPVGLGRGGGLDGGGGVGVGGVGEGAKARRVAMRLHNVGAVTVTHAVLPADDVRQIDRLWGDCLEGFDEPGAFTRTWCVFVDRLVRREGHVGDGVHAARMPGKRRATHGRSDKATRHL
jgi:hypothetical protein